MHVTKTGFFYLFFQLLILLIFYSTPQLRLLVRVCMSVCVRAFADLPCEQWHLYALLIANQWALWDVWDALKAPTRHILVRQHMHEH